MGTARAELTGIGTLECSNGTVKWQRKRNMGMTAATHTRLTTIHEEASSAESASSQSGTAKSAQAEVAPAPLGSAGRATRERRPQRVAQDFHMQSAASGDRATPQSGSVEAWGVERSDSPAPPLRCTLPADILPEDIVPADAPDSWHQRHIHCSNLVKILADVVMKNPLHPDVIFLMTLLSSPNKNLLSTLKSLDFLPLPNIVQRNLSTVQQKENPQPLKFNAIDRPHVCSLCNIYLNGLKQWKDHQRAIPHIVQLRIAERTIYSQRSTRWQTQPLVCQNLDRDKSIVNPCHLVFEDPRDAVALTVRQNLLERRRNAIASAFPSAFVDASLAWNNWFLHILTVRAEGFQYAEAVHGDSIREEDPNLLCANCYTELPYEDLHGQRRLKCQGCKSVRYCDRQCQLDHWHVHKHVCKKERL